MPQFSYKARRRTGEVVEGVLEVADRSAALLQIERLGLFPVAVDSAKGAGAMAVAMPSSRPEDGLAGAVAAGSARRVDAEAQAQATGAGHLHATVGKPAQIGHAADGGAQQHDAPGDQGHIRRGQPGTAPGCDGRAQPVRRDGETAAGVFGSVCEHGARGGIQRRAGGGAAAHGGSFRAVCPGADEVHFGADLPGIRLGGGPGDHVLLHDLHAAEVHVDFSGHECAAAVHDADFDRHQQHLLQSTGG